MTPKLLLGLIAVLCAVGSLVLAAPAHVYLLPVAVIFVAVAVML